MKLVSLVRGYEAQSISNGFGHLGSSRGSCIEDFHFKMISLDAGLCFGQKGA